MKAERIRSFPSIRDIMNAIIPITRFNRGEASKIFDEVNESGVKLVFKNNSPVGVLLKPEQYEAMVEMLENYALWFEAEKRMRAGGAEKGIPHEQVLEELGISKEDLADVDVDLE